MYFSKESNAWTFFLIFTTLNDRFWIPIKNKFKYIRRWPSFSNTPKRLEKIWPSFFFFTKLCTAAHFRQVPKEPKMHFNLALLFLRRQSKLNYTHVLLLCNTIKIWSILYIISNFFQVPTFFCTSILSLIINYNSWKLKILQKTPLLLQRKNYNRFLWYNMYLLRQSVEFLVKIENTHFKKQNGPWNQL